MDEGSTRTYTVNLNARPAADVTVTITATGDGDITADTDTGTAGVQNTLTFTPQNFNTAQTVTLNAAADADLANGTATIAHAATGGGYDGLAAQTLTATERDTTGQIKVRNANDSADITTIRVPENGSVTYGVKLSHLPTGNVSVQLRLQHMFDGGDDDIYATPDRLSFNTSNWNVAQTVTLRARDDSDRLPGTRTITHTATGGGYNSPTAVLTATESEDDIAVLFSTTALSVDEGSGATYEVSLSTAPTSNVTVTLTGNADGDAGITFLPASLTFTTTNYSTGQTVGVSSAQDSDLLAGTRTITHTANGGGYVNVTADLKVTEVNNDAGLVITPSALTIPEGGSETYTVQLATAPTANVTIALTGNATGDADITFQPASLTFTGGADGNWDTAQTVTVRAAIDTDDTAGSKTIEHTATGGNYGGLTATLTATEREPVITITSSTGTSLIVNEGGSATYTVAINNRPTGTVRIAIDYQDGGDTSLTVNKTNLSFNSNNWQQAQTVTVRAAADGDVISGSRVITHTASGGAYAGLPVKNLTASEVDDDKGVILSKGGVDGITALSVKEQDASGETYGVRLSVAPTAAVTVTLTSTGDGDIFFDTDPIMGGNQNTLTFTTVNYATAQTVTVKARNDSGSMNGTKIITHTAGGAGSGYESGAATARLTVTELDDEKRMLIYDTMGNDINNLDVDEGGTATYRVKLSGGQPSGNVTVTLTETDADLSLDKTTLNFTTGNWNSFQSVTVSAAIDADGASDSATVTHAAAGGGYDNAPDAVLTVNENDLYELTLTAGTPTATTVPLTIANGPNTWYYNYTTPHRVGTCSAAVSGTTATATGLTQATAYTFKAYSDSACATELATTASVTTATPTLGRDGQHRRQRNAHAGWLGQPAPGRTRMATGGTSTPAPTGGTCTPNNSTGLSGQTATATGLQTGVDYTFAAYRDSTVARS